MLGTCRLRRSVLAATPRLLVAVATALGPLALPAAVTQAAPADPCKAPWDPAITPTDFTDAAGNPNGIDNPYFPLRPGTTFVYQRTTKAGEIEREEVRVTNQKKTIQFQPGKAVTATVVRDEVTIDGKLAELTFDWFAQHDNGTVWYFGEDATEFPSGSKAGSWEAGVNGAKPGRIMLADPRVGDAYRQEFAPGVAEDAAEVKSVTAQVTVPYGRFSRVLQTRDFSCLEPGAEDKYYAPGVGLVLEVAKGQERLELIGVTRRGDD
jgi:hypothetical protein